MRARNSSPYTSWLLCLGHLPASGIYLEYAFISRLGPGRKAAASDCQLGQPTPTQQPMWVAAERREASYCLGSTISSNPLPHRHCHPSFTKTSALPANKLPGARISRLEKWAYIRVGSSGHTSCSPHSLPRECSPASCLVIWESAAWLLFWNQFCPQKALPSLEHLFRLVHSPVFRAEAMLLPLCLLHRLSWKCSLLVTLQHENWDDDQLENRPDQPLP